MMTDVSRLVSFTGSYSINVARGAFLSIDTIQERSASPAQPASPPSKKPKISVSVSMDGSSTTNSVSDGATFDGVTLNVPGHLTLDFNREYREGRLASFAGTIGGVPVNGETHYNQVPLSAFVGDYYDVQSSNKVLSTAADRVLRFDFSLFSTSPKKLGRCTFTLTRRLCLFSRSVAGLVLSPTNLR
jgi:hypothetical protein